MLAKLLERQRLAYGRKKQRMLALQSAPSGGAVTAHCGGASARVAYAGASAKRGGHPPQFRQKKQDATNLRNSLKTRILKGRCPLRFRFSEEGSLEWFIQFVAAPLKGIAFFGTCDYSKHPKNLQAARKLAGSQPHPTSRPTRPRQKKRRARGTPSLHGDRCRQPTSWLPSCGRSRSAGACAGAPIPA